MPSALLRPVRSSEPGRSGFGCSDEYLNSCVFLSLPGVPTVPVKRRRSVTRYLGGSWPFLVLPSSFVFRNIPIKRQTVSKIPRMSDSIKSAQLKLKGYNAAVRPENKWEEFSLLPALCRLGPEVAVTALAAFGCLGRVGCRTAHADGLVKEPFLSLFEACHVDFLWTAHYGGSI